MKLASILAVAILVISQLESSEAAATLEKAGYKFLGSVEDAESTSRGLRAVALKYYASTDLATHNQALKSCKDDFDGQLVTPLNPVHINNIRQVLEIAGETGDTHFWTAGKQIGTAWSWSTTGNSISSLVLNSANFAPPNHEDVTANGRCLSLFGQLGNFGLCDTTASICTNSLRYICEV